MHRLESSEYTIDIFTLHTSMIALTDILAVVAASDDL